jgi:hypothetical protein
MVNGVAAGSATITALHSDYNWYYNSYTHSCNSSLIQRGASSTCNVERLQSFNIVVESTPVTNEVNSVVSGQSAQINVQAIDTLGGVFNLYTGTVHFSSTDTAAALPADYTFTSADNGAHMFNITLKSFSATSATRDLTVKDNAAAISTTQNINLWFNVFMDVERWKNCNFVSCPNLGSYLCQTAYTNGYSAPTAFVAVTASDRTNLYNNTVTVRYGSARATTFIGDAGPTLGNYYWNTGTPPSIGGCLSDLLATNLGVSNGCSGSTPYGSATVFWRFGS